MEEDNNYVGLGGGADKVAAALQPGVEEGATSNCMADEAKEGAKEVTEEWRSDVIWEVDKGNGYQRTRWLYTMAMAITDSY